MISAPLAALLIVLGTRAALALPGDTFAAEKARLAANASLVPLAPLQGVPGRWSTRPRSGGDETRGDDGWAITLRAGTRLVTSETLEVKAFGKPYAIVTDGAATFASAFGAAAARDLAASAIIAVQHEDAQVTQTFRRGARFGYRVVDDRRDGTHTLELVALPDLPRVLERYGLAHPPSAPAGGTVSVVDADGALVSVVSRGGDVQPAAGAALAPPQNVQLILGDRTVTGVPVASTGHGPTPPASRAVSGSGSTMRRAPTASERATILTAVATKLGAAPSELEVRDLVATDLGRGPAFAGTVNLRGDGAPRVDRRVFFVDETIDGRRTMTLWNLQWVTVTEPLLEEPAEYLTDALDIGHGKIGLVTHLVGDDADAYTIYTRDGATWRSAFAGGGVAF